MKNSLLTHAVLVITFSIFLNQLIAQNYTFPISCAANNFTVSISEVGSTKDIKITWTKSSGYALNAAEVATVGGLTIPHTNDAQFSANKLFAKSVFERNEGRQFDMNSFSSISYTSPTLTVNYSDSYQEEGITDITSTAFQTHFFTMLSAKHGGIVAGCTSSTFFNTLTGQYALVRPSTTGTQILNNGIISSNNTAKLGGASNKAYYYNDIRNPITFTKFVIRNPKINGKGILITPSNNSSYNYIRPGSNVLIEFASNIYDKLNGAKLSIKAYLKRKDESVVPVNADAFYKVDLKSNSNDFEKNNGTSNGLNYSYEIKSSILPPLPVEISTANLNPAVGDKLVIIITNVSDGNVSFTTSFEFEDYGWTHQASGGFAWVNSFNTNTKDFVAAGSAGYSFYYKYDKGAKFGKKFFMPSFGPELVVMQGDNQKTVIGMGLSVSLFLRTIKVGYGWNIIGNNGRPYVSLGVNFIEGFQSISSILKNVQTTTTQQ